MTKRTLLKIATLLVFLVGSATAVSAQNGGVETRLLIRAVAHDAKLIGTSVGGAHITIREVRTGRILADGVQEGGTGDTDRIIDSPRIRYDTVFDTDGAAFFLATIVLEQPILVDITAYAPLGDPEEMVMSTKRMLVVPGRHVEGEGILLELNGLTVKWLGPDPDEIVSQGSEVVYRVKVTMLCGCPTEPEGRWDSNSIDIVARIFTGGKLVHEQSLSFSGERSIYEGSWMAESTGEYVVEVLAMDDAHGNFGRTSRTLFVDHR